jgi:hypothetical protein
MGYASAGKKKSLGLYLINIPEREDKHNSIRSD